MTSCRRGCGQHTFSERKVISHCCIKTTWAQSCWRITGRTWSSTSWCLLDSDVSEVMRQDTMDRQVKSLGLAKKQLIPMPIQTVSFLWLVFSLYQVCWPCWRYRLLGNIASSPLERRHDRISALGTALTWNWQIFPLTQPFCCYTTPWGEVASFAGFRALIRTQEFSPIGFHLKSYWCPTPSEMHSWSVSLLHYGWQMPNKNSLTLPLREHRPSCLSSGRSWMGKECASHKIGCKLRCRLGVRIRNQ
jgi:hypothetical protein